MKPKTTPGTETVKIEPIGPLNLTADFDYFRAALYTAIHVPLQYITGDVEMLRYYELAQRGDKTWSHLLKNDYASKLWSAELKRKIAAKPADIPYYWNPDEI